MDTDWMSVKTKKEGFYFLVVAAVGNLLIDDCVIFLICFDIDFMELLL